MSSQQSARWRESQWKKSEAGSVVPSPSASIPVPALNRRRLAKRGIAIVKPATLVTFELAEVILGSGCRAIIDPYRRSPMRQPLRSAQP